MIRSLIFLLFLIQSFSVVGQDSLKEWTSIPLKMRSITVDELGNIYLVRSDNELLRYNAQWDSTGFYKGVYNGPIESVDATNPLNILIVYLKQNRLQVLDRMLAPKFDLNLASINVHNAQAAAMSVDGNVWVYDRFNVRLLKLNNALENQLDQTDLRQVINEVPDAHYMIEQDRRLFIADSLKGVYIFDQFGNYLMKLPILIHQQLQMRNNQILYLKGDEWNSYNIESFQERKAKLPLINDKLPMQAQYMRGTLYLLYEDQIVEFPIQ